MLSLHSSARKQHIPTVELLLVLQITQLVMPLRREFTKLVEASLTRPEAQQKAR